MKFRHWFEGVKFPGCLLRAGWGIGEVREGGKEKRKRKKKGTWMPWEGAAKPADQFPFLSYAPWCKSSPAEGLLLPSVTLRAPGCRVTHRHSLTHTRKRVPRPRPARLCCRPPVPTGVTGGWGQGHGHPPRFGAKCVLWGAPLRPLVQQA